MGSLGLLLVGCNHSTELGCAFSKQAGIGLGVEAELLVLIEVLILTSGIDIRNPLWKGFLL